MIKTEHNGHEISYAENEDVWRCWAMSLDSKTLSGLKAKLNDVDAAARRLSVPVICLAYHGPSIENLGKAVLIADAKSVWVVVKERNDRTRRLKKDMERLVLDTPENRALIAAANAKQAEADAIEKVAQDMLKQVPRVTFARLKSLNAASQETKRS